MVIRDEDGKDRITFGFNTKREILREEGCQADPEIADELSDKGQGFATEAVMAVLNELAEIGFKKVTAKFFEGNIGSLKVMEKCGMHLNGHSDEEEYRGKILTCYECELKL